MKTQVELFYSQVLRRENKFKELFLNFFLAVASYPRLLLEVFIRKNFGERYFSFASAITVAVILILLPYVSSNAFSFFRATGYGYGHRGDGNSDFWWKYATWYAFILGFLYVSFRRWQEIRRNPSVFDFAGYTLNKGDIHPFFFNFKFMGKKFNIRQIEILIEPLAFFIAGFILYKLGQNVGMLIIICSIFYSLGYAGSYKVGDDYVMDLIDKAILAETLKASLVDNLNPQQTKGFNFYPRKPTSKQDRERLLNILLDDDLKDAAEVK